VVKGTNSASRLWLARRMTAKLAAALPGRDIHAVADSARPRPSTSLAICRRLLRDISCQHQLLGTPRERTGRFSWRGTAARQ
jgi:hypothetical protein